MCNSNKLFDFIQACHTVKKYTERENWWIELFS